MGMFDSILKKLGFGNDEDAKEVQETAELSAPEEVLLSETEAPEVQEGVVAISEVDVVAKLEALSAENPGLNWKTSIVDLLKLLGIDSSYANRKELAAEMGIEGYEGTAEQNIALHKAVLKKIAENGGNIPQELLD
jgi:hypothetical protein